LIAFSTRHILALNEIKLLQSVQCDDVEDSLRSGIPVRSLRAAVQHSLRIEGSKVFHFDKILFCNIKS